MGGFSLINVSVTEINRQMDEPYNPECEEYQNALASGLIKANKLIKQASFYGVALVEEGRKKL